MSSKTSAQEVIKAARSLEAETVEMRRYFHEHPELSFHEKETARVVEDKLSALGYKTTKGVGKTGVLGDLNTGKGPGQGTVTVAIRADMDGLPVQEVNETKFVSKNEGVSHACGHDGHMASALTAAKLIAQGKIGDLSELGGSIRMVMQPAEEFGDEEGKSGAYRMLEDNALDGCSAIIGLHMDASLPAGKVGIIPGPIMAAADSFVITILGKGGHGAYPETAIDAVVIGAQVVQAIQSIVSRRISALDPAIVTIGSFHSSSTRGNVISESVRLEGTFRTFNQQVREHIIAELERACSLARVLGGDFKIEYELGYPTTVNDPEVTEIMRQAAIDLIGAENVIAIQPKTWSEDFSMFAEKIPGAFMFLGAEIKGSTREHHSATFDLDESGLYIGPAVLAETARRLVGHYKAKK
ncbi:MAG: amidohydrolase [Cyanobacteria bacterium REEB67]|nr:amidohydrolase [Cyanobacteria bacterium REEB67]